MNENDVSTYKNRKKEFVNLLNSSHSKTSQITISEAIRISDENFKLYVDLSYKLFQYLTKLTQEKKDNIDRYNDQFTLLETNLKQVSSLDANKEQKEILTVYYQSNLDILSSMSVRDRNLNSLMSSAYQFVTQEIKTTLFDYIYKPNQSEFRIDMVIDIILLIADKFVPFLGDVRNLMDLIQNARKKSYLKTGDKLFQYLEKYIDISKLWQELIVAFSESGFDEN